MNKRFLIAGAGLTGATIARKLAEAGFDCDVFEELDHVAGNCHTARDEETGIMVHQFGPHTLHTDKLEIWDFLKRFVEIYPYFHTKQAWAGGHVYPFPINLQTLNKFFDETLSAHEVPDFLKSQADSLNHAPTNFEEAALSTVGRKLYEAFYRGYTIKQWGRDPKELPPFIFRRLPVHSGNDQNVFHHKQQGQPVGGYTHMVEKMLEHPRIHLYTNRGLEGKFASHSQNYHHLFYSGPIDRYFDWHHGRLAYRTLDFQHRRLPGQFQDCATVNYCDLDIPHTRIAEHKLFWPWEKFENTVITYEVPRECMPGNKPYYPIRLSGDEQRFNQYVELARREANVSFVGRLGTYRYLDMDAAIDEALLAAETTIEAVRNGASIPSFFVAPQSPP